ncbi:head-tail adaptor [Ralstonia phage RSJ2]|uniref:Putative head portal-like protein n=1 Tax=Ralstonia phage RSJ2 TaxID=1481785 RepID=A0A068Q6Y8_9CAUD|nr:head-tail adaptor [Ralstonia phage RSJ2]BAP15835.1 putative head portal-like protein [Ralstonia phage RSJ2]
MRKIAHLYQAEEGKRASFLMRCQRYASLTLPQICTPDGYDEMSLALQTDYQSVGAQGVNNLANKLMLALFAPSRPFFRLDIPDSVKKQLQGVDQTELQNALAMSEKNAVKRLDGSGSRPKLYEAMKHLIITGNALMVLPEVKGGKVTREMRIIGIKKYVVKRNQEGKVVGLIIKEKLPFDELTPKVKAYLQQANYGRYGRYDLVWNENCDDVEHYTSLHWDGKDYWMRQAVDENDLPDREFGGKYTDDTNPYRVLTWDLADENNYGTGLVEQCEGDLAAVSTMSEAVLKAAVLASEFRWLVNPAGITKPEDFMQSPNGAALPGVKGDVELIAAGGNTNNLQTIDAINSGYINRLGRSFLMSGAVIRDAERVTAEEVRIQAQELETSLGGVYSRLAIDFQRPIAFWLIRVEGVDLGKAKLEPVIVTGLDALSRNGDVEQIRLFFNDLAGIAALPPQVQGRLKLSPLMNILASARGLNPNDYVMSDDEFQQQQDAAMQQQMAADAAPGMAIEATKQGAQPQ